MGTGTPEGQARWEALRKAYEVAFHEFSHQVRLLQSVMTEPTADGKAIEGARRRAAQARHVYRENRDLLTQFMLSRNIGGIAMAAGKARAETAEAGPEPQGSETDRRPRVERLAYQLWDEAGRPSGKAEEHWYLAERLIRNAP